eukprot:m.153904 g.153904  ORF g.153904 m.153904 type:complete len:80 (+) comp24609_c0_seq3:607-846(+)
MILASLGQNVGFTGWHIAMDLIEETLLGVNSNPRLEQMFFFQGDKLPFFVLGSARRLCEIKMETQQCCTMEQATPKCYF